MAEESRPLDADLARLVRQHLDSLRGAGVEWLPAAPPLPVPPPNPGEATATGGPPVATTERQPG